jgi:RNA polymerase sigma factor (sigma-70 family)
VSRTEPESSSGAGSPAEFTTTQWSVVLQACQSQSPSADEALAKLCQTYWYPLYVFVRRQGQKPQDAQDLVQAFFARLLEKKDLEDADRAKGKFRSFLLIALKRFLANEWDRVNRLKRGGGRQIVSLDEQKTEDRYLAQAVDEMTPEKAFERQWAFTLLDQVVARLKAEFSAAGKAKLFSELKTVVSGQGSDETYGEIGDRLGMSEGAVKVAIHRLRHRYRELLREEIAHTIETPEAIDEEIRLLFAALS